MTGNYIRENHVAYAAGEYTEEKEGTGNRGGLSCVMAMILGALCTIELMTAGAMIFNIDVRSADLTAIFFAFLVLYFGVVAVLTDR